MPTVDCPKLKVSGDDYKGCLGTYTISSDKANKAPERPVWKKAGYDHVIYTTGDSYGWRLGRRDRLSGENEGHYLFKSKYFFLNA